MEHLAELPAFDKVGVSCIVPAPQPGVHSEELRRESAIDVLTCDAGSFGPLYHRLAPPLHLGEDVLTWIDPTSDYVNKLEVSEELAATRGVSYRSTNEQITLIHTEGILSDARALVSAFLGRFDVLFERPSDGGEEDDGQSLEAGTDTEPATATHFRSQTGTSPSVPIGLVAEQIARPC